MILDNVQKNGKTILSSVGWISVVLLTCQLMAPLLMFIPICIGVVLRRDYEADSHGLALIVSGIVSGIIGWVLGIFLMSFLA